MTLLRSLLILFCLTTPCHAGDKIVKEPPLKVHLIGAGEYKPVESLGAFKKYLERYRVEEMLGYINSEIHKAYSPLFSSTTPAQTVEDRKAYLAKRYKFLDEKLAGRDYLLATVHRASNTDNPDNLAAIVSAFATSLTASRARTWNSTACMARPASNAPSKPNSVPPASRRKEREKNWLRI